MEIKKLLEEISAIEYRIEQATNLINLDERGSFTWVVSASNNSSVKAFADNEFLIEAVKSARHAEILRLEKLKEAVRVVEKVIDGIVSA